MTKRRGNARTRYKIKYLHVKPKFKVAIRQLQRMNTKRQRQSVYHSSNQFIKDFASAIAKLRNKPHLVSAKHAKEMQRHRRKLQLLARKGASIKRKRKVLNQRGGIAPFLIPIIAASIGAAGSVAGAAAGAAVARG